MVDFQSRYKIYAFGHTAADVRDAVTSYSKLYRDKRPHVLSSEPTRQHACISEPMEHLTESNLWQAQILAHGLTQTFEDITNLHTKPARKPGIKWPEKLLFHTGIRGSKDGNFRYPRALDVTFNGNIVIADTDNNRIQIVNQVGLFLNKFGGNGNCYGELDSPNSVSVMFNDDIAVSEPKNKRIQIYGQDGGIQSSFKTHGEPCCIVCDDLYNVYVGTTSKTVEVYDRAGNLSSSFNTSNTKSPKYRIYLCLNDDDEIIVLDTYTCDIKLFSLEGSLKSQFHLESPKVGLTMQASAVCLDKAGQILVADSLNRMIIVYNSRGDIIKTALGPADGLGCVQSCRVGPEGHLIVTEFSLTGEHTLKIFRFNECVCHYWRSGSSKRKCDYTLDVLVDFESALSIISDS